MVPNRTIESSSWPRMPARSNGTISAVYLPPLSCLSWVVQNGSSLRVYWFSAASPPTTRSFSGSCDWAGAQIDSASAAQKSGIVRRWAERWAFSLAMAM
jgi:hypothetical protein